MNRQPPGFRHSITITPISRPAESTPRSPAKRAIPRTGFVGLPSHACRAISGNTLQRPIPGIRRRKFNTDCAVCHRALTWQPAAFFPHDQWFPISAGSHHSPAHGTPVRLPCETRRITVRLNASIATSTTRQAPTTLTQDGMDTSTSARHATGAIRRVNGRNQTMIRSSLFVGMFLFAGVSAGDAGQGRSIRCRVTYFTSAQIYFDGERKEGLSVGDTLVIARGDTGVERL